MLAVAKQTTKSRVYWILTALVGSVSLLYIFPDTVNWWVLQLLDPPAESITMDSVGAYIYMISVIDFVLIGAYLKFVLRKNPFVDQATVFGVLVIGFVVFCLSGGWKIYF